MFVQKWKDDDETQTQQNRKLSFFCVGNDATLLEKQT